MSEKTIDSNKIKESRLPDSIKQMLMKKPPVSPDSRPQNTTGGLDKRLFENASKIIKKTESMGRRSNEQSYEPKPNRNLPQNNENIDFSKFRDVIRDTIRDTVKEEFNNFLKEKDLISEGFEDTKEQIIFKVNDTIFKGNITGVKKAK